MGCHVQHAHGAYLVAVSDMRTAAFASLLRSRGRACPGLRSGGRGGRPSLGAAGVFRASPAAAPNAANATNGGVGPAASAGAQAGPHPTLSLGDYRIHTSLPGGVALHYPTVAPASEPGPSLGSRGSLGSPASSSPAAAASGVRAGSPPSRGRREGGEGPRNPAIGCIQGRAAMGGLFLPYAMFCLAARPRSPLPASARKRGERVPASRSARVPFSQSCMSFLHLVSFHLVPLLPPPGSPARRDPDSRVSCAGAGACRRRRGSRA